MSAVGFEPTTKSLKDSCAAAAPRAQLGNIVLITAQFSSVNYNINNFHTVRGGFCQIFLALAGNVVIILGVLIPVTTTNWGALSE
jgi:hypothetical protein